MKRIIRINLSSTLFLSLMVLLGGCGLFRSTADRSGWYVRICATETSAERIWFTVSAADGSSPQQARFSWRGGNDNLVAIPRDLRHKTDIQITADTRGRGVARLCVAYENRVIKNIDVVRETVHTLNNNTTDVCPC